MTKHTDQDKCHCDECSITRELPPSITVHRVPHHHRTDKGELVKCYHECKSIIRQPSFWIITTLSFPVEHGLWTLIYNLFGWGH